MKRFLVRVVTKTEIPYVVEAECAQEAVEYVLAGDGYAGDPDYPEPDVSVEPLER